MQELLKNISNRPVVICTTLVAVPMSVYLVFKYYRGYTSDKSKSETDMINQVLFFSNDGAVCKNHFHQKNVNCPLDNCPFRNIRCMIDYILSAQHSLDVCLYLITVKELADIIVEVHKRGVKVRIITDEDMANGMGSQMILFRRKGIKVRNQNKTTTLMHHKFVIIDKRIVMTGSLNWTMQAVCGNWDNLVVTSQPQISGPFVAEFDRLWEIFSKTC